MFHGPFPYAVHVMVQDHQPRSLCLRARVPFTLLIYPCFFQSGSPSLDIPPTYKIYKARLLIYTLLLFHTCVFGAVATATCGYHVEFVHPVSPATLSTSMLHPWCSGQARYDNLRWVLRQVTRFVRLHSPFCSSDTYRQIESTSS